ncbi:hypothetical protein IF1G_04150 [Cordyceps javanica]|uniref:Uncharacterized protein n=1 Tax=Cordyceps javanica TaxID=43265 RepID=A0A545V5C9_9HYPO|nr:hypothetical protein IF1G_04150 [Cordyceps javanica]
MIAFCRTCASAQESPRLLRECAHEITQYADCRFLKTAKDIFFPKQLAEVSQAFFSWELNYIPRVMLSLMLLLYVPKVVTCRQRIRRWKFWQQSGHRDLSMEYQGGMPY